MPPAPTMPMTLAERDRVTEEIQDEVFGLGPLEQLLKDTRWRDLDYLVVDLPPGTGDIQLTLAQKVPVTGAVIVTTPQDIALLDARKALKMFEKVNIPILGIVENMSIHICSKCGHEEHIFGTGGGGRMSKDYAVDLLGSLPLDIKIREQADSGKPTVVGYTRGDLDRWSELMARSLACAGALPGDIVHNGYGYGLFTGGLGAHYGAERLGLVTIPLGGGSTATLYLAGS